MRKIEKIVLPLFSMIFVIPLLWIFWTSFKTYAGIFTDPWPHNFISPFHRNFVQAFEMMNYSRVLFNSVFVLVVTIALFLLFSILAAYAFAKLEFKGKFPLLILIAAGMFMPSQVIFIPLILVLRSVGLQNTLLGVILPQVANGIPLGVLVLTAYFIGIHPEIIDAAKIDGCKDFQILWKIAVPLSMPAIVAIAIFKGLLVWSEFAIPLITLQDTQKFTLPLAMQVFRSKYGGIMWPQQFAGLTLSILPQIFVFFIFFKKVATGIRFTAGIKG